MREFFKNYADSMVPDTRDENGDPRAWHRLRAHIDQYGIETPFPTD